MIGDRYEEAAEKKLQIVIVYFGKLIQPRSVTL